MRVPHVFTFSLSSSFKDISRTSFSNFSCFSIPISSPRIFYVRKKANLRTLKFVRER